VRSSDIFNKYGGENQKNAALFLHRAAAVKGEKEGEKRPLVRSAAGTEDRETTRPRRSLIRAGQAQRKEGKGRRLPSPASFFPCTGAKNGGHGAGWSLKGGGEKGKRRFDSLNPPARKKGEKKKRREIDYRAAKERASL